MPARDVSDAAFASEVIERSRTRPVVVDFWAPWCAPCRQLSPLLERAADRWSGVVDVAKVNVDEAQAVAKQYRVQGIPAVKGFKNGTVVREFVGLQPEATIEALFAALAPSEADRLAEKALSAEGAERESLYREALAADAGNVAATVGLARLLAERGDTQDALAVLERLPGDPTVQRLLAEIRLGQAANADVESLGRRSAAGDVTATLELGRALAGRGRHHDAVEALLIAVGSPDTREPARQTLLELFTVLGDDHSLVRDGRRRLSAALF